MRKEHREGEAILASLGFKLIERGHGKHHYWIIESPSGRRYKQPIPHNTSEHRFWLNWKTQLRRKLNDERDTSACTSGHQPAGLAR